MKPGGIILLGGKSQRMGTDKYLLPFFNFTLIERLIVELEKAVDEIILITRDPDKISFLPHKKYGDAYPVASAFSGLHAGLKYASAELNFVLACDLPLFDARMVPYMIKQMHKKDLIAVPKTPQGFEPLCGLYAKKCLSEIEKMFHEKNFTLSDLYKRVPTEVIPSVQIEAITHPDVFFNMNTPDEYETSKKIFAQIKKPVL